MRQLFSFLLATLVLLLVACTPDTAPLHPTPEVRIDARSSDDCIPYEDLVGTAPTCQNFSGCVDLAGKRPITIEIGPPKLFTGQMTDGPDVPPPPSICGAVNGSHPFSFLFTGFFDDPSALQVVPHLGRLQSVEAEICVRPFILPSFQPVPPFLEPIPYDLYPVCHDLQATYTFTGANGDQLTVHIQTDGFPDCDNPEIGLFAGQWTVADGTGRFADATGGGCVTGSTWANLFDPEPQVPFQLTLEGGIDY